PGCRVAGVGWRSSRARTSARKGGNMGIHAGWRAGTMGPRAILVVAVFFAIATAVAWTWADDAPGAPGDESDWGPAAKDFLGTSLTGASRVYFTGADGIVSEVYYPTIDTV